MNENELDFWGRPIEPIEKEEPNRDEKLDFLSNL